MQFGGGMSEFKYGFILNSFFNKYFSQIKRPKNYIGKIYEITDNDIYPVFIGKNVDFIEFLYLNHTLKINDLKTIDYVNELNTFLWETPSNVITKFFSNIKKSKTSVFESLIQKQSPVLIFLKKSSFLKLSSDEFKQNPLSELVELQKKVDKPIVLIPQILVFEKEPKDLDSFMKNTNPNFLKIIYQLMKYYKNSYAKILEPINLNDYMKENKEKSDNDIAESLWSKILYKLDKEEQIVTGPTVRTPKINIEQILLSKNVVKAVDEYSKEKKITIDAAQNEAKKILDKMMANYSFFIAEKFAFLVGLLFKKIYDGIIFSDSEIERLKELSKEYTLVYVPCHKSHIDYLAISYIFLNNGLVSPHIAAGDNLSFFPMGFFFRKSGAFFLKRTFKGDNFYATLFNEYINKLLNDKFSLEFFIEGGRSRTGKLLPPKTGMMSMVLDSFFYGLNKKIALIPVAINYEKVVEEKSYIKELYGQEKQKENINTILSNRKILNSKFGRIYIRFAEPLKLDEYFKESNNLLSKDEKNYHLTKISYKIMHNINKSFVITATPVLGLCLLTEKDKTEFQFSELLGKFLAIVKVIYEKNVNLSNTFDTPVLALEEAVKFFKSNKLLNTVNEEKELYSFGKEQRAHIEYYKNSIIHLFINEAFLFTALLKSNKISDLKKTVKIFSSLFRDEFIFNPNEKYDKSFNDFNDLLISKEVLVKKNDELFINDEKMPLKQTFYTSIIMNFIESYHFCIKEIILLAGKEKISEKGFIKYLINEGLRQKNNIKYNESINKNKFENCLKMLIESELLTKEQAGKDKFYKINNVNKLTEMKVFLSDFLTK